MFLPALDIDVMRTFVAVCETGNFSKAADRVHRTPSAVSLQIKKLEEMLGRVLFRRESRETVPLPDAETLLAHARRLIALNDDVVAGFMRPRLEGRVSFGAPNDSGAIAIPSFLRRFASTHPHVDVDVVLDTSCGLRRRSATGELDLILFAGEPMEGATPVMTEDLVWIGLRHGDAVRRRPLPLSLADVGCVWRAAALAALDGAGIPYRLAYGSEHCQGQLAAIEADLAVAPLPLSVATPPFVRLGDETGLPRLGRYSVFMKLREGAGPATTAFASHIASSFEETVGRGIRLFA